MNGVIIGAIGVLAIWVAVGCGARIVLHAFRQSAGTGFIVLCIPLFVFVYAFAHFEHRHKGWIVAGFIGGWGLGVVLQMAVGLGAAALFRTTV
jgi:translocator protein